MNILTTQANLQKAITSVSQCIKGNVSNPLFSCAKLSLNKDGVRLDASDALSGISVDLEAKYEGEGEYFFNPNPIGEYLSALGAGDIALKIEGDEKVTISRGASKASFPLVQIKDYPTIDIVPPKETLSANWESLLNSVVWASLAVATDDSRPVLTGVLLKVGGEGVVVVGSDGYRLSLDKIEINGGLAKNILIPQKPLLSFLKDGRNSADIRFWLDERGGKICFSGNGRFFYIRLIVGDFPDFTKILPTTSLTSVTIDRDDLAACVRQVSLFARQSANTIRCEVDSGRVRLFVKEGQGGYGEAVVDAKISGDPVSLAFNYRYLQEYIRALGAGEITMSCNGSLAPVQFVHSTKPGAIHIIMPVNIKS